jgi:hypothetical protein
MRHPDIRRDPAMLGADLLSNLSLHQLARHKHSRSRTKSSSRRSRTCATTSATVIL